MATATRRPTKAKTAEVARKYFNAASARDVDAMAECWAPDGVDRFVGQTELHGPDEVRAYFTELFAAFPDWSFEVLSLTTEGGRCAVRWRATGTLAGAPFNGIEPNGARLDLEGVDVLQVGEDGLIVGNEAFMDGATVARQIGMLPAQESPSERRMTAAFNARTRVAKRLAAGDLERVADGVWLIRGGFPFKTMNVYFLEDDGGVTIFDAGIEAMTKAVAAAGASLGGIRRVVLGHGHGDHRGSAPGLGVPVLCHPAEREDAEGDGGAHYFDYSKLESPLARILMPRLIRHWDGGPVKIAGTVEEGDEVAGFRVVHLPGHAPGLIGLWRESDRLALVSDCFYTLDPQTGRKGHPRVPHRAFNPDTEQARASIRKLAAMEPREAWAGHADPVTGDVRSQLEQAAATT